MKPNMFITLRSRQELVRVNTDDLITVVCDSYCSTIHSVKANNKFTTTKSLKEFEKLTPPNYLRINKNTIVN